MWVNIDGTPLLIATRQQIELKRQMADAYGVKAEKQCNNGDEIGANQSWDYEIKLKTEANALYKDDV